MAGFDWGDQETSWERMHRARELRRAGFRLVPAPYRPESDAMKALRTERERRYARRRDEQRANAEWLRQPLDPGPESVSTESLIAEFGAEAVEALEARMRRREHPTSALQSQLKPPRRQRGKR
jgi:hypothetical protein